MRTPCIVAILLAAITTHAVSAQQLDPSMCDQLAKLPNPPMSVEACKSMFGLATMLDRMADDPRGIRPGDDAMSCAAIFDDMKTMTDVGLSRPRPHEWTAWRSKGRRRRCAARPR